LTSEGGLDYNTTNPYFPDKERKMSDLVLQIITYGIVVLFVFTTIVLIRLGLLAHFQLGKLLRERAMLETLREARKTHPHFSFDHVKGIIEGYLSTGDRKRDEELRQSYKDSLGRKRK